VQAAASGSCAATRTPSRVSRRSSSSASAPASSASLPCCVVLYIIEPYRSFLFTISLVYDFTIY
jgi:hypothetical protein